jgi:guanosine-3',5'-bis(diphosphate) 3'-pyrophosphohydrolase
VLRLDLINEQGALANIASLLSRMSCNIENVTTTNLENHVTRVELTISVLDRNHLLEVIKKLKVQKWVLSLKRKLWDEFDVKE